MDGGLPKLYGELASWWPIFSRVEDYAEEAEFFHAVLAETGRSAPRTLLELGSGGGNNASFLKAFYEMTLVDRSPQMLSVSRGQNPACEHIEGDMRTLRLGRQFDAVFVHDAIMYMTTESDLCSAMETAYVHCRPGGVALFVPDCVRETFSPATTHGGHDGALRSIRYLEWTYELEENASSFVTAFAYLLRERGQDLKVLHEEHVLGLFGRQDWHRLLAEVGFETELVIDPYEREIFVGRKPFDL